VLPNGGDILISQEAATYRPEMEWIAARLQDRYAVAPRMRGDSSSIRNSKPAGISDPGYSWRVVPAENYEPQDGRAVYRFFELFDLPNIAKIDKTLRANAEGRITITPPKRKCGSRFFGFNRCASFGDANWARNTSSSYKK
jgi:hypothetical protein